jgi:hypothetical protein
MNANALITIDAIIRIGSSPRKNGAAEPAATNRVRRFQRSHCDQRLRWLMND